MAPKFEIFLPSQFGVFSLKNNRFLVIFRRLEEFFELQKVFSKASNLVSNLYIYFV